MVVPYKFTYLVAGLIHLFVWLILYWHRKDIRKEMWVISILVMIVSVIAEFHMWTVILPPKIQTAW